jgi:single-stranded DNA-binding protein
MALPKIDGVGRLLTEVRKSLTSTQKPMASAILKFPTWHRQPEGGWEEGDGVIASIVAFEDVAKLLARYARGDEIAIWGTTAAQVWKDTPQLKVTLSDVQPAPEKPTKRRNGQQDAPAATHDTNWPAPATPAQVAPASNVVALQRGATDRLRRQATTNRRGRPA